MHTTCSSMCSCCQSLYLYFAVALDTAKHWLPLARLAHIFRRLWGNIKCVWALSQQWAFKLHSLALPCLSLSETLWVFRLITEMIVFVVTITSSVVFAWAFDQYWVSIFVVMIASSVVFAWAFDWYWVSSWVSCTSKIVGMARPWSYQKFLPSISFFLLIQHCLWQVLITGDQDCGLEWKGGLYVYKICLCFEQMLVVLCWWSLCIDCPVQSCDDMSGSHCDLLALMLLPPTGGCLVSHRQMCLCKWWEWDQPCVTVYGFLSFASPVHCFINAVA